MPFARTPKYSPSEHRARGEEIYNRSIKLSLAERDHGKLVAVDVDSGSWEMDEDDHAAVTRLLNRLPEAQIWLVRVGDRSAYRIGGPRRNRSAL